MMNAPTLIFKLNRMPSLSFRYPMMIFAKANTKNMALAMLAEKSGSKPFSIR